MDPITDMLNRIRNAYAVSKKTVDVPFSNFKENIVKILEKEGLIDEIQKRKKEGKRFLHLALKYKNDQPLISDLKRISKQGKRIYIGYKNIKSFPLIIISTSKGLMANKEAKKQKLGGEIICEIW
ncbi:30S ribosomal protein S8 [bacterium (Candidatus Gribaldobacteria) CG07_land_8_20_14_0_80_33_18]|uniref:Small ribosomal subunit protein uS8 n=1 Tax=bacterium (Candidatus Gribaldobacteria) CG07_land_8_20_14_0_80_33_18 TaxID=2014272 RepID=A0A2M6Z2V2_9BACT|nr:MAG: 30S ribosomal protein S8 [bacterium (Candidatus Gribaldobacteria) CG10_big_fil_rev_8_21_14_0_10_33_41]PIU46734.1 MAG: 30S ribosomal protein S8 [bacterium (Candidatus Gribaldobacteria) CG07_land_8_20_14_0_80_33_18]PJA00434.1 MAG: 30S ribosomal protein S8 [bacterium (Candidatus Gribaldobacteria) CG_4_10_14_0_2_um_filter_33_15]PJB08443.1 MAG: 30S ribosomal protein S8 [bacterium (Candidatus Gribaldobacteria) CG_4_9_14_3_um_filter_33_9]